MMGALSGRDPKETLRSVFTLLSGPVKGEGDENLITLDKLKAVCKELKVIMSSFKLCCSYPCICSCLCNCSHKNTVG
jgi:hypothetical protein